MSRNQKLAEAIAEALFTNGAGEQADHLVLMANKVNLGGWGYRPAIDQIRRVLESKGVSDE